jgi:O-acetyl-ADP-ribose deacetylase (regulator of RNase III)
MISEETGSLLDAPADALVNTVNTVGVMGKGLALQFKQAYPGNFRAYQAACRNAELSWLEGATVTRGGASLLEIQKLMYFLQEAGQPLRLNYAKGRYGPYADNLNHVLQALEGHYLRGYGDRTQRILDLSPITLADGAADDARQWLKANADGAAAGRIAGVTRLVTDFASPYGVELLATVHWTATRETRGTGPAELTAAIRAWNPRKERLFTEHHVHVATEQLRALSWLG